VLFFLADNGVHSTSVGARDAAEVTSKIMTSEWLFRIGFVSFLFAAVFFLLAAWALYRLLKVVNHDLALLFLLLNLVGVSIKCVSLLCELTAMLILSSVELLKAFQTDQLQAVAILLLGLYKNGFMPQGSEQPIYEHQCKVLGIRLQKLTSSRKPNIRTYTPGTLPMLENTCTPTTWCWISAARPG